MIIFCEAARTGRFSVIFAKVHWHPWSDEGSRAHQVLQTVLVLGTQKCVVLVLWGHQGVLSFCCGATRVCCPFAVRPPWYVVLVLWGLLGVLSFCCGATMICPSALGPLGCLVLVLWGHQCSPDALGPLACGALVLEGHLGVMS